MKRNFHLYYIGISLFWIGVFAIMLGHYNNLGTYPFWQYTISRQVGWTRWSEITFAAVNVIAGILVYLFVRKNISHWSLSKNLERLLYGALVLFFLTSFIPYDPTLGTVLAHQIVAFLMLALAGIFVLAILLRNKPWKFTLNSIIGISMMIVSAVSLIMFAFFLDTIWNVIFFVESFYILAFYIFLPTVPAKDLLE